MNNFLFYFILFIIYSMIGWMIEMFYVNIKNKTMTNRGFLIGPYCPIYGTAALLMITILSKYKNDVLILFFVGIVIASFLEYITSFILEKIFKARWWDYSNKILNIDGRVCLLNSIVFGIFCILLVNYINPFIINLVYKIPTNIINIISIILICIFVTDFIISFKIILKIKKSAESIRKDYTDEISYKVKEVLINQSKWFSRVLNAFPNFKAIYKTKKL
jgi:uncharacterized membrane protein